MNYLEKSQVNKQERRFLPPRASEIVDAQLEELEMVERGDGIIELSIEEKKCVLSKEKDLAEEFQKIYDIVTLKAVFYNERYTNEDFKNFTDVHDASKKSTVGMKKAFFEAIDDSFNKEDGSFDFSLYGNPTKSVYVHDQETIERKIQLLREFKKELKKKIHSIDVQPSSESNNIRESLAIVYDRYRIRVNTMIADINASQVEDRQMTRYDTFIHGAGENGAITKELNEFASHIEKERMEAFLAKKDGLSEQEQAVAETKIPPEESRKLVETALEKYDLLSSEPASTYSKERVGFAKDDKWQVVFEEGRIGAEVSSKRGAILLPKGEASLKVIIQTWIGHEIEGHVLQRENRRNVPIEMIDRFGGDRTALFSEMGAMSNEDKVAQEIFSDRHIPHTHYLRAIEKRLQGGSYRECVEAFYENVRKELFARREFGEISQERFETLCKNNAKIAIDRGLRLFRKTEDLEGGVDSIATSKKDLVYLEQRMVHEVLQKEGKEQYSLIGGMNLDTIIDYTRAGLMDLKEIKKPKGVAQEIWSQCVAQYYAQGA